MRYTSVLSRFLINLSLPAQLFIAVFFVLLTLFAFLLIPGFIAFPLIFVIPVVIVSWLFRRGGLIVCLLFLFVSLWTVLSLQGNSILLPPSITLYFILSTLLLFLIGSVISSQRDSLELAEAAQEQLELVNEQQQWLHEIKDQFLQNVNHELRTPLTAIYGYLELLLEHNELLDSEMRVTFLQHAMQSCDELQLLVNNVLDSMGIEKEKKSLFTEELAVADIVYEVLQRFDPKSVQAHSIDVSIPDYIVVRANAQYLRQVLRNLLSNAFKYVPPGTPITISAVLYGKVVHPLHASPEICISVKDCGPGIPPEDIPNLFGQFVRLKRDTSGRIRGSGLGLFLSRQFVEAMGGRIWVESEGIDGQGSCFCFTLPAVVRPKVHPQTTSDDFTSFRFPVPLDLS